VKRIVLAEKQPSVKVKSFHREARERELIGTDFVFGPREDEKVAEAPQPATLAANAGCIPVASVANTFFFFPLAAQKHFNAAGQTP
jgi:hypothetical protein